MALPGSPHDGTIGSAQLPGNNEAVAPDRAAGVREDAQPAAVHRNIRKELFMRSKNMNIKIWPRKKNDIPDGTGDNRDQRQKNQEEMETRRLTSWIREFWKNT